MLALILLIVFLSVAMNFIFHGKVVGPLSIVVVWWCIWLSLSMFGFSGLHIPTSETYTLFILLLFFCIFGYSLFSLASRRGAYPSKLEVPFDAKRIEKIAVPASWILALFMGYFLLKAGLSVFGVDIEVESYRSAALGSANEKSIIFDTALSYVIYSAVIVPTVFFVSVLSLVLYIQNDRKKLLLYAAILLIEDALVTLGRFSFYYLIILAFIAFFLRSQRFQMAPAPVKRGVNIRLLNKKFRYAKLFSLLVAGVLLGVSLLRVGSGKNYSDILSQFLDYHTIGFVLFDKEYSDPVSFLNRTISFGRASVGGLDEYVVLVLKRFYSDLEPIRHVIGTYQNTFVYSGTSATGDDIFYNAYYTVLYSLYLDGGVFGVICGGLIFGAALCSQYRQWVSGGQALSLVRTLLLTYLGLFSIFISPLEGPKFWISWVLTYILGRWMMNLRSARDVRGIHAVSV